MSDLVEAVQVLILLSLSELQKKVFYTALMTALSGWSQIQIRFLHLGCQWRWCESIAGGSKYCLSELQKKVSLTAFLFMCKPSAGGIYQAVFKTQIRFLCVKCQWRRCKSWNFFQAFTHRWLWTWHGFSTENILYLLVTRFFVNFVPIFQI